jgi:GH25 family lysozyme M1 (1,4-beta-N-acetylmuramidase)
MINMATIYGVDISNYQGDVDFAAVKAAGHDYVIIKATEGTTLQDSMFKTYYEQAKSAGLKVGAYHFLVGTSAVSTQVQNFYNMIKDKDWDIMPVLDTESDFSNVAAATAEFVSVFKQVCPWQLCIYSYTSFINEHFAFIKDTLSPLPLWIADYTGTAWNYGGTFLTNIVGHQYTEKGTVDGISTKCDVDVFTEAILLNSTIEGDWIYDPDKELWWYKHTDGSFTKSGWEQINGSWYLFDADGWMLYDWKKDGNVWYFLGDKKDGSMKTGWVLTNNKWYYFNEDGAMQSGWLKYNEEWYYLGTPDDGAMKTGWISLDGKDYLLDSHGVMYANCNAYGYHFGSDGLATRV